MSEIMPSTSADSFSADPASGEGSTASALDSMAPPAAPAWHNVVAGSIAGAGSRVAVAPLDLLRIRRQLAQKELVNQGMFQSWKTIFENEGGYRALFRGNVAAMYLWMGYMAVQFAVYGKMVSLLERTILGPKRRTATAFVSGAVAGLCATLATYPIDVCRTTFAARGIVQQQQQKIVQMAQASAPPKTLQQFVIQLYRQRGLTGFFAGVHLACVEIVPYMGINFAIYEALTKDNRSVGVSGYAGSISGGVSKIAVYPLDTIKKRLQAQAFYAGNPSTCYTGVVDCAQKILLEEGATAFYRGVVPSVLKATISTSLCFGFYRLTKNVLESISHTSTDRFLKRTAVSFGLRRHSKLQ